MFSFLVRLVGGPGYEGRERPENGVQFAGKLGTGFTEL